MSDSSGLRSAKYTGTSAGCSVTEPAANFTVLLPFAPVSSRRSGFWTVSGATGATNCASWSSVSTMTSPKLRPTTLAVSCTSGSRPFVAYAAFKVVVFTVAGFVVDDLGTVVVVVVVVDDVGSGITSSVIVAGGMNSTPPPVSFAPSDSIVSPVKLSCASRCTTSATGVGTTSTS